MLSSDSIDTGSVLNEWLRDARTRTLDLTADLLDEQLCVPHLDTVNPFIWEIGHVAWFQEKWVLRHANGQAPIRADGDQLFDSMKVEHDGRWTIPLPSRKDTVEYACEVADRVSDLLELGRISDELAYLVKLSVFHEDMHAEAFTYMRQSLGYTAPPFVADATTVRSLVHSTPADIEIAGRTIPLGASRDEPFVFDNEKWEHPVRVESFTISAEAVTQEQFARFVDEGGYRRRELWSDEGWAWREQASAARPVYWSKNDGCWRRRIFDKFGALESHLPMIHVNWYEAQAWCNWAGRRLPTEAEWELAAAYAPDYVDGAEATKRRYPWGDESPTNARAILDWNAPVAANTLPNGQSAFGCRHMLGNVWEWTSSEFGPYPGFAPDHYKEYSQPWFFTRKVLRGGCWATRSRLLRNTFRNFYTPERRDIFAGFRTCAT